jgi:hypothetical protein
VTRDKPVIAARCPSLPNGGCRALPIAATVDAMIDAIRVRRCAGFGCAGAMGLYLGVKALWIGATVLLDTTPSGWESGNWVALNIVTAVMASAGVALGLAIAHGWGQRAPAPWVVTPLWLGSGFLVTMLPYSLVLGLLRALDRESRTASTGPADGAEVPGWESALLTIGFVGMALGLLVGVPLYVRARWPWVFAGGTTAMGLRDRRVALSATMLLVCLAATYLGWAAGLGWGLRPGVQPVDGQDRLLMISSGAWCLVAVAALVPVVRNRGASRSARAVLFLGSGSLTAWGGWKLAITSWDPPGLTRPELLPVAYAVQACSVLAGLAVVALLWWALPRDAR